MREMSFVFVENTDLATVEIVGVVNICFRFLSAAILNILFALSFSVCRSPSLEYYDYFTEMDI